MILINNKERTAKYLKIKSDLVNYIKDGSIGGKDGKLPAEDDLSKMFGVSRTTIRSALQALAEEGRIIKKHGIGNFVQQAIYDINAKISFYDMSNLRNAKLVYLTNNMYSDKANAYIASKLNIKTNSPIIKIFKEFALEEIKSLIIVEHFPLNVFVKIPDQTKQNVSIYEFIKKYCHEDIGKITTEIIPLHPSKNPFSKANAQNIMLKELFFTKNDAILAYTEVMINTKCITLRCVNLEKP